jgi:hypothetical protein
MSQRIGNTNYIIKVFNSENAAETFEEKVLRLARNDSFLGCMEQDKNENEEE